MSRVSVLGLGTMGSRIALRLLGAGCQLTVWNRSPGRSEPLAAAGAAVAKTPAECVRGAEFVITMLSDAAALDAVASGAGGIVAGIGENATWLEMSTVGPPAIARLATRLDGKATLVDSPVLGSVREVESGRLVLSFGGPAETFRHSVPLLETLGRPIHVGGRGSGAAAKLVANSTLITAITALGEAIRLGDGLGLGRPTTFEVLAATAFAQQAERRRPLIESGEYPPRFTLALADTDARLVLETGVELPVTAAAERWFAAALATGLGDADYSAVLSVILDAAARPEVVSDTGPASDTSS